MPEVFNPASEAAARADEMIRALQQQATQSETQDAPRQDASAPAQSEAQETQESSPPPDQPLTDEASLREALRRAEHEAATWRGRHKADVARLQAQIEELTAKFDQLAATQSTPQTQTDLSQFLEVYGEDMINMVKAVVNSQLASLEAKVAALATSLESKLTPVREATAEMKRAALVEQLNAKVPDWQTIDRDPAFHAWLSEYDPLLGGVRKEALDQAVQNYDNDRVVAFFQTFRSQTGGYGSQVSPAAKAPQAPAGNVQPSAVQSGRPSLEEFAAPGVARSSGPVNAGTDSARIWTRKDIAAFYSDLARGKYRDRQAEARAIELEIARANAEGRIMG